VDWSPHLRKFASMKIQVPHFRGGFGITPNEGSTISHSTLPPARLSSGWVATGATDLPKTLRTRGRQGWILLLPTPGMHLFSRLFHHRMLFSFRIMGVLNGPLSPIECPRLWQSRLHSLLCSQVSAPATLLPRYLL